MSFNQFMRFVLTGIVCFATMNVGALDTSTVIITPVPAPKEITVEPQGYVSCGTIPAGWYGNEWRPEYKVCRYNPNTNTAVEGEAWVAGYWACNKYDVANGQGVCTNWNWVAGHWVKTYQEVTSP